MAQCGVHRFADVFILLADLFRIMCSNHNRAACQVREKIMA